MFCDACGTQLEDGARFCRSCGKQLGGIPAMPARSRMAGHFRLLGILWLAFSAFRLVPAMVLYFFLRGGFFHSRIPVEVWPIAQPVISFVWLVMGLSAILGLIAGWALLDRRPWGRMLALIMGCIALLEVPFGTALGIYTLWVLLPAHSEQEYRRLSEAA